MSYKVWLVLAQAVGYGMSKFVGVKVISELKNHGRRNAILILVCIAGMSWLFFALVPAPFNIVFLVTNGLPLGMIWGIIFAYLEGRKVTEVLAAALCVSFIFSSGLCRSIGAYLIQEGVAERWMPFVACCLFILPLIVFAYLLDKVPPPSTVDIAMRTQRRPMNGRDRRRFLMAFLPGIFLFVIAYMLLTAFRDFRDNFSVEVWESLGYGNSPKIFTTTEVPISLLVLVIVGALMFIRNNHTALVVNHIIIGSGMLLIGISSYLFQIHRISPSTWMIAIGLGLYLGYVPFNSIFFDRLLAAFRYTGTVGFIMYVADSFGYLASLGILFYKELALPDMKWLDVFLKSGYIISIFGTTLVIGSAVYFHLRYLQLSGTSVQGKQRLSTP